jgi:hypothetical protein
MPNRAALLMILYAIAMVALGVLAYLLAPADAKSLTALIIPSACALLMLVCAVLSWRIKSDRTLGMVGIHLGLILPLVFAGAFFMTGGSRFMNAGTYQAALDAVESAAAHVPADAPLPVAFYFQTNQERADQLKAQADGNTSRGEKIVAEATERRDRVNAMIDQVIADRGVALTDTQRGHARATLALLMGDRDRFPINDQAYLGRILMVLFGVSLAFFVAILAQRGSATSAMPVASRGSAKKHVDETRANKSGWGDEPNDEPIEMETGADDSDIPWSAESSRNEDDADDERRA